MKLYEEALEAAHQVQQAKDRSLASTEAIIRAYLANSPPIAWMNHHGEVTRWHPDKWTEEGHTIIPLTPTGIILIGHKYSAQDEEKIEKILYGFSGAEIHRP